MYEIQKNTFFDTAEQKEKRIGYLRCYYKSGWNVRWFYADGDTSLDGWYIPDATEEEVAEINDVSALLFKMFPNGAEDIESYCREEALEYVGDGEYNAYIEGSRFNYWIRFRTAGGDADYSIYLHCYKK